MNSTMEEGFEPKRVYAVFYGCILALGLPLNAVSLWPLLRHHGLKSSNAVYMINLAISDLLLGISLPMRVYFYATGTWPLNKEACIWITMFFHNNMRSSAIFITLISVDRLLAVVYPLRSRHLRTPSNALKAVGLIWLFVVVINIPERILFSRFLKNYNESTCFEYHHQGHHHHHHHHTPLMAYIQSVLVFIMLAVNIVCTTLVSLTLRRHLNDSARINNKLNVMLIFVMNLVMFTICFLPLSIASLIYGTPALTPLVCLTTVNCCLDPLLYYFSLDSFWKKKEDTDPPKEQQTNDLLFS